MAIGLVAYVAADIAHHALGHAAMCLLQGGQIELLSSIFVRCSRTAIIIDLAGPCANLVVGLIAVLGLRGTRRMSVSTELFYILLAGFNLMWFSLHLVFSVVTDRDDWAWLLQLLNNTPTARYSLIGAGVLTYVMIVRYLRSKLAPFARPVERVWLIVGSAWLSAGVIACATAAFDHNAPAVVWHTAIPQSLLLSIGFLFLPARAERVSSPTEVREAINVSWRWMATAAVLSVLSIVFLGRGVSFGP